MSDPWPWLAVAALGAYHGLNPAMGWLFAVALGLQEGRRGAVLRALPPIALGHEASVALVVLLVSGLQMVTAPELLRAGGALALLLFGAYKLLKPRSHPRWVGFRLGMRDLALWSLLMSTAHGAGLMLLPVLLGLPLATEAGVSGLHDVPAVDLRRVALVQDVAAIALHTLAMLLVMAGVALLVYDRLGVAVLRKAWLNLDGLWATAFLVAGIVTLVT